MGIRYYTLTREQLEQFLQLSMHQTLLECVRRGELTMEQAETIQRERTPMILTRDSLLEKLADWIFGKGNNDSNMVVMVPLPKPSAVKP